MIQILRTGTAAVAGTILLIATGTLMCPSPSRADTPLGLQSYEPSAFGYTKYNNDVSYENIQLSVKFPLAPDYLHRHLYVAFTGVFGFYIRTRDSGPVVGKEYNPKLFWQQNLPWQPPGLCEEWKEGLYKKRQSYGDPAPGSTPDNQSSCYFKFGYNHDSNGQIINSYAQYVQVAAAQGTQATDDAISRGWDYLEFGTRFVPWWAKNSKLTVYPHVKYFLARGLLQEGAEEVHDWEIAAPNAIAPDAKPRKEVDGLSVLAKYENALGGRKWFGDGKLAVKYTTGYQDPFRYSTVRLELGIHIVELPIVVWAQKGYMSDLAQYYHNVTGYGIQIEIGAF